MAHILFLALHFLALFFGIIGLVITIPLHIIYSAISSSKGSQQTWRPHKNCPYCKMKIDKAATKCPYCQEWISQEEEESLEEVEPFNEEAENRRLIDESMPEIQAMFSDVVRVDPSPYQFYVLVHHRGGTDVIQLGGFNIKTIPKGKLNKFPKVQERMESMLNG